MKAPAMLLAIVFSACADGKVTPTYLPPIDGDPNHGAALIQKFGCGGCHEIGGIPNARGLVGPPLRSIAFRTFIGGEVPNTPDNLVEWIMNPHAIESGTAMPTLGLTEAEAKDVVAYLYLQE